MVEILSLKVRSFTFYISVWQTDDFQLFSFKLRLEKTVVFELWKFRLPFYSSEWGPLKIVPHTTKLVSRFEEKKKLWIFCHLPSFFNSLMLYGRKLCKLSDCLLYHHLSSHFSSGNYLTLLRFYWSAIKSERGL